MRNQSLRLGSILLALSGCNQSGLPGSGAAAPPGTVTTSALDSACGFADPAGSTRAVLAFTVDHDLRFTFADGSTRTVYTFASPLPSQYTGFIGRVDDVKADRVLADGFTDYAPPGQPGQSARELVLLDRQGRVQWSSIKPDFGTPYLGDDGTLAVWENLQDTLVVRPDGSTRQLVGQWSPVAPDADGSLLVQAPPPVGDGNLGWVRPGASAVDPIDPQPNSATAAQWVGGRLAYVGKKNGQDALILATSRSTQTVALAPGPGGLAIAGIAGKWFLVEQNGVSTPSLFRVDSESGAVESFANAIPDGMRRFDGGTIWFPQLADDGSITQGFRNDYVGSLYRSTDLGASWTPVGLTVSDVQAMSMTGSLGGTFIAQTAEAVYAPSTPWSDPPAGVTPELSGPSVQLARPADGVGLQLSHLAGYRPVALGAAGQCASYWTVGADKKSGHLEVLDAVHAHRTILVDVADVSGLESPLWLER